MTIAKPDSLWTRTFLLLCAAQFLGYAQNAMLAPILPLYVTQLGGSPFIVGMVLATFAATSVIIRPLVGHWADRWSEAGVIIAGFVFRGGSQLRRLIALGAQRSAVAPRRSLGGLQWGAKRVVDPVSRLRSVASPSVVRWFHRGVSSDCDFFLDWSCA